MQLLNGFFNRITLRMPRIIFFNNFTGFFLLTFNLFFIPVLFAENPTGKIIFKSDTIIHEIRLNFYKQHAWEKMEDNYKSFHDTDSRDTNYLMASFKIDGIKIDSIGVKMKSYYSYEIESDKKPLKLLFSAFVKNKTFDGFKRLNLSNEFPDPSMLRNTVAYKIFRKAGAVSPRTSFVKLYVNNVYKGLYVAIEQIDKTYIANNLKSNSGDLFKALGSSLFWESDDMEALKRNFELKTRDQPEAWTQLNLLCKKINTTPANVFHDSLRSFFDFRSYLTVFATDVIFNNWDSYFYGHNYYLYRDSLENKFYFLAWDYNISLNSYEVSGTNYSILPGMNYTENFLKLPLPSKIIENDTLKIAYLNELKKINEILFSDSIKSFIKFLHKKIRPALVNDTGKIMTMAQYDNSLEKHIGISDVECEGLLYFIRYRHEQIATMLEKAGIK